ncbi:hypothetical protein ACJ73_07673 [Blastomyces percursus]|uniref:Uncharacterized protein n=1 Tax=Blastomyces percursus TaxID=1658174 RepID=A0A1J9PXE6_9EURO|nr:hypothetical protein ACJ73_07673 [Blastomyces percursus]
MTKQTIRPTEPTNDNNEGADEQLEVGEQMDADTRRNLINKLHKKAKWMYLVHLNSDDATTIIHGGKLLKDSIEYEMILKKVRDCAKGWKHRSINKMIDYVSNVIEAERTAQPTYSIANAKEKDLLYEYFIERFTKEDFIDIFVWTVDILDYDNSSELAKWFMMQVFANLAVEEKLHVDITSKHREKSREGWGSRAALLQFWDDLGGQEQFDPVHLGEFAEVQSKPSKQSKSSKTKNKPVSTILIQSTRPAPTATPLGKY